MKKITEPTDEVDELAVEAVVKRSRGRPRKEKPVKEKRPPGRPKKLGPMKEKRPRGRPRKIREFREKRPVGRPKKWEVEDRPKYKNRRTLKITRTTIVMLSSQSWKLGKPSHTISTCYCII